MATEADVIASSDGPVTSARLLRDLRELGVCIGDTVVVHSSLSALGWVPGGAQTVVEALLASVGPEGTIVMPTQSGQLSDPGNWDNPPVPSEWVDTIRSEIPAYDAHLTPTRSMGQIVETFRQHRATVRGPHPTVSFAANGPLADSIVGDHTLAAGMSDASPLGRLYALDARVLLLGVGHANNTSLHLAEHRADWPGKVRRTDGSPMLVDGERRWVVYDDLDRDDDDFEQIGSAFAATGAQRLGNVGVGEARWMSQRDIVDFAVTWMSTHRS